VPCVDVADTLVGDIFLHPISAHEDLKSINQYLDLEVDMEVALLKH
jgi:hypothetical protein